MSTKILIDVTPIIGESSYRGIGKYVRNVLPRLVDVCGDKDAGIELLVQVLNEPDMDMRIAELRELFPGLVIHFVSSVRRWMHPNPEADPAANFQGDYLAAKVNLIKPDFFLVASPFSADCILPATADLSPSISLGCIIYDMIPLRFPDRYLRPVPGIRNHYYQCLEFVRRVDRVFAISKSARNDLVNYLGIEANRISVIYAGVEPQNRQMPVSEVEEFKAEFGLKKPFVFYISGYDHRKNFQDAVRAFGQMPERVREGYQLLLISRHMPEMIKRELRSLAQSYKLEQDSLIIGDFLSEEWLTIAYQQAACLIFPSEYEGFGLPVIEALSAGTPVLSARNSSLKEIFEYDDAFFETHNIKEAGIKLARILTDESVAKELLAEGQKQIEKYTWQDTAARLADGLIRIAEAGLPARLPRLADRKHVAIVTASMEFDDFDVILESLGSAVRKFGQCHVFSPEPSEIEREYGELIPHHLDELENSGLHYQHIFYLVDETEDSAVLLKHLATWPGVVVFLGYPQDFDSLPEDALISQMMKAVGPHRAAEMYAENEGEWSVPSDAFLMHATRVIRAADVSLPSPVALARQKLPVEEVFAQADDLRETVWQYLSTADQSVRRCFQKVFDSGRHYLGGRPEDADTVLDMLLALRMTSEPRLYCELFHFWDQAEQGYITGIQRVVGKLYTNMAEQMPEGSIWPTRYRMEAGRLFLQTGLVTEHDGWTVKRIENDVMLRPGDTYFVADLVHSLLGGTVWHNEAERLHSMGVNIEGILYDLLPVQYPDFFEKHFKPLHEDYLFSLLTTFNHVHCISRAVADELIEYAQKKRITPRDGMKVSWFHLGADVQRKAADDEIDADMEEFLDADGDAPVYLMVGTIEKRKNHKLVLESFRKLWAEGRKDKLLVIGRRGWLNEEMHEILLKEEEDNPCLMLVEKATDAELEFAYSKSTALIAASVSEGFGLPLIEASSKGARLIANDIPVFREVAGEHADYYDGTPEGLADLLARYQERHTADGLEERAPLASLNWAQVAEKMITKLETGDYYAIYQDDEWSYASGEVQADSKDADETKLEKVSVLS